MHLQQVNLVSTSFEEYSPAVQAALRIADEVDLLLFPRIEAVVEVLKRIPHSQEYFTHLESGEYGYSIKILIPVQVDELLLTYY